jgi:hypothetical protein
MNISMWLISQGAMQHSLKLKSSAICQNNVKGRNTGSSQIARYVNYTSRNEKRAVSNKSVYSVQHCYRSST